MDSQLVVCTYNKLPDNQQYAIYFASFHCGLLKLASKPFLQTNVGFPQSPQNTLAVKYIHRFLNLDYKQEGHTRKKRLCPFSAQ